MKAAPDKAMLAKIDRIIQGAIRDVQNKHADYFSPKGARHARASIAKRAAGEIYTRLRPNGRGAEE